MCHQSGAGFLMIAQTEVTDSQNLLFGVYFGLSDQNGFNVSEA